MTHANSGPSFAEAEQQKVISHEARQYVDENGLKHSSGRVKHVDKSESAQGQTIVSILMPAPDLDFVSFLLH